MKRTSIAVVLLVSGFLVGRLVTTRSVPQDTPNTPSSPAAPAAPSADSAPSKTVAFGLPDLTTVASNAVKGVVNISSVQLVRRSNSPFATDPMFQYFFGFGGADDMFGAQDRRQLSLGSGVLVSPDGYVVTNSHVIGSRAQQITVAFADKRELPARIIGTDPATDIALVKINNLSQAVVPWGDSSKLRVGDWVLAIGSPYQLNQTVTLGIVSGVGRANVGFADYEDFIQTDAAINPGNSGGALVNTEGQLIGINTGILSQSGGYQGIGFAVPSDLARRVIDQLIKYGEVRRGSIGALLVSPLTTQLAAELGVESTRGALVTRMERPSPAYDAGIRPGDMIVSFNGQSVEDPPHLLRLVADARIGSSATIGLIRDRRSTTVRVPIVQRGE